MNDLASGFAEPAIESARAFREIMECMARPGRIGDFAAGEFASAVIPPAPLSVAAGLVLLTLCDHDTPLYLAGETDSAALRQWLAFHTGAPVAGPEGACFALGTLEALAPLSAYPVGTPSYPDRSTTLIVEVSELASELASERASERANNSVRLSGPGIQDETFLTLPDAAVLEAARQAQNSFPLGLDFIFTCGSRLAALPRTTRIG